MKIVLLFLENWYDIGYSRYTFFCCFLLINILLDLVQQMNQMIYTLFKR